MQAVVEVVVPGFSFFRPHPRVADIIEAIWDIDLPDASSAQAIAFKVLPAASQLCACTTALRQVRISGLIRAVAAKE
jgi:hypothetical protein